MLLEEARASTALDGETQAVWSGNETAPAQGANGEVPGQEPPARRHLHQMEYTGQDRFVNGSRQRLRRCACGEERWT